MSQTAVQTQLANVGTNVSWTVGREVHRAAIRPYLGPWLRDELRRRDYGQTLSLIKRLKVLGTDMGVLTFYEAELLRLRRKDGDLDQALAAYQLATTFPDAPSDAWRELGDAHSRSGKKAEARAALEFYLVKAPNAADKALVSARLERMRATN